MTFESWFASVDKVFSRRCGMGVDCLPDAPYYDWYEDGLSPDEAFEEYVESCDDTGLMGDM